MKALDDDTARAALMSELIRCEPQAQSKYQPQAITFKKSESRSERAVDRATWASVTRVRDGSLSQQQQGGQSTMMTQTQLDQVVTAIKNACLHDQAYQQQMVAASLRLQS